MLKYVVLVPFALWGATGMAQAIGGSFQNSCENIQQRGPYLSAECRTIRGDYRRSSIDVRGCAGGVSNNNGRLTCGGGGYDRNDGFDRRPRFDDGQPRRPFFRVPAPYQGDDEDN